MKEVEKRSRRCVPVMLDDATRNLNASIRIYFQSSGKLFNLNSLRSSMKVFEAIVHELLYANDCVLEAHILEEIQLIMCRFAESAERAPPLVITFQGKGKEPVKKKAAEEVLVVEEPASRNAHDHYICPPVCVKVEISSSVGGGLDCE
ncbi:unnamed protein product [Caretta caretta]